MSASADAAKLEAAIDLFLASAGTDEEAFGEIVAQLQPKALCIARKVLDPFESEADLVVSDGFVKLITTVRNRDRDEEEQVANVSAFLHRIVRNTALNLRKKLWRERVESLDESDAAIESFEEDLLGMETLLDTQNRAKLAAAAKRRLSPDQCKIIDLRLAGLTHEAIAKKLGIKVPTSRKRLSAAFEKLRDMLEGLKAEESQLGSFESKASSTIRR
jgi:RNA polymerase sigma factor (sigma-70 family)